MKGMFYGKKPRGRKSQTMMNEVILDGRTYRKTKEKTQDNKLAKESVVRTYRKRQSTKRDREGDRGKRK